MYLVRVLSEEGGSEEDSERTEEKWWVWNSTLTGPEFGVMGPEFGVWTKEERERCHKRKLECRTL